MSLRFDTKSEKVSFDLEANPTGWQDNCFFRLYRPRLRVLITAKGLQPSTAEGVRFKFLRSCMKTLRPRRCLCQGRRNVLRRGGC